MRRKEIEQALDESDERAAFFMAKAVRIAIAIGIWRGERWAKEKVQPTLKERKAEISRLSRLAVQEAFKK